MAGLRGEMAVRGSTDSSGFEAPLATGSRMLSAESNSEVKNITYLKDSDFDSQLAKNWSPLKKTVVITAAVFGALIGAAALIFIPGALPVAIITATVKMIAPFAIGAIALVHVVSTFAIHHSQHMRTRVENIVSKLGMCPDMELADFKSDFNQLYHFQGYVTIDMDTASEMMDMYIKKSQGNCELDMLIKLGKFLKKSGHSEDEIVKIFDEKVEYIVKNCSSQGVPVLIAAKSRFTSKPQLSPLTHSGLIKANGNRKAILALLHSITCSIGSSDSLIMFDRISSEMLSDLSLEVDKEMLQGVLDCVVSELGISRATFTLLQARISLMPNGEVKQTLYEKLECHRMGFDASTQFLR